MWNSQHHSAILHVGTGREGDSRAGAEGLRHLVWLPAACLVGFMTAFVFGDVLTLPVDVYYLLYFASVGAFMTWYVRTTGLDVRKWLSRRLVWSVPLGLVVGLVLMQGVLARPETAKLSGALFAWALFWRGLVYGAVDGILLFSLPWVITWRAFDAERRGAGRKVAASVVAWGAILLVTTAYHLGYADFRSSKILQPGIGSAIGSASTLLTANPVGSPISHVLLHVTAVIHSPETDLFLPPHRAP